MSDRDALNLIFLPGFSTAAVTTDISGRGVGLDVVRENVARLGGRIEFTSVPEQGTRFLPSLPLTLAAARGLFVRSDKDTYCIPLSAVEEARALIPDDVGLSEGQHFLKVRANAIPFVQLADLLAARPSRRPERQGLAVLLALSDRRIAVGVDEVLGQEEMVVRSLAAGTPPLKLVAGATAIADGTLVTVLEPAALLDAMQELGPARAEVPAKSRQRTILVVDDALTTRSMLVSLLDRVGFRTLAAADGEAGYALLRSEPVDLVVSDVEMPGLDGVALTRRIRATAGMDRLPVILVTSLATVADRARGAESGANGYVVKSDFDPEAFVQMVREELGAEDWI